MPTKELTWNWLESRLVVLNAKWIEAECDMYRGKLNDVNRGKTKLTETELRAVKDAIRLLLSYRDENNRLQTN